MKALSSFLYHHHHHNNKDMYRKEYRHTETDRNTHTLWVLIFMYTYGLCVCVCNKIHLHMNNVKGQWCTRDSAVLTDEKVVLNGPPQNDHDFFVSQLERQHNLGKWILMRKWILIIWLLFCFQRLHMQVMMRSSF